MSYKCKLCGKEVQLLKNHIKNTHNLFDIDDYFSQFSENEKTEYEEFMISTKEIRKQRSPNSINFYTQKGYSEEEALIKIEEYRNKALYNREKESSPRNLEYWTIRKNLPIDEAKIMHKLFQSRSKDSYLKKYGCKGEEMYNRYRLSIDNRHEKCILKIMEYSSISREDALEIIRQNMIRISPRRKEYWLLRGFTEDESELKVSNWQKICSPRTKEYFKDKGLTEKESSKLHSLYQGHTEFIHKNLDKYDSIIDVINSDEFKEKLDDESRLYFDYISYRYKVDKMTDKNYRKYKKIINPDSLIRGSDYHLDHIVSIYEGYITNTPVEIISSPYNLRIISSTKNKIKGKKSDMDLQELINLFKIN